jgi:hypothetical protein
MNSQLEPLIFSAPLKFCRDCKYLRVGADYTYAKCGYTVPGEVNLVTGEPKQQPLIYCDGLRESKNELCCGPQGKFFEARA